ncbi:MAG: cation diffusion facilitator family transporter [Firmicutes bacterium]|nr:cation diffusion facilitator family transporter [Bacillota bacterium]
MTEDGSQARSKSGVSGPDMKTATAFRAAKAYEPADRKSSDRTVTQMTWLSAIVNVLLTIVKAVVGTIAHSDALIADAAHSASDVAGSVAVMIGLRVARRPADQDHPYGHGKAEFIAASLVAILLILAGVDVVYNSVRQFFLPIARPEWAALLTAVGAVLVKEVLYRYQNMIGRKAHSPALLAGAADHRSDVYSSLLASVGIGIALIGQGLHVHALFYADPIAGLFVALVVVRMGYKMADESFRNLLDQVLDSETTASLNGFASAVPGVLRVDDLRARTNGSYWMVDVEVSVDPEMSVLEGHQIARTVKWAIIGEYPQVRDVLVHVNPFMQEDD